MLKEWQYFELQAQFMVTPHPDDGFSASGQHYKLLALLNKLGYHPNGRDDSYKLTEKLLSEDYERDSPIYE